MATTQTKGKKSKAGRQTKSPAHARYKSNNTREKNKVRRVLKSSGMKEAEKYGSEHGVISYLKGLPAYLKMKGTK